MLNEIVRIVLLKSITKDLVKMAAKNSESDENVVREKLGTSTIDEFMRMDVRNYGVRRGT